MEIYLKTDLELKDLSGVISKLLNVSDRNPTPHQAEQQRHSENHGGTYYLFEVLGLELLLLRNRAEATIPERAAWPFYLLIGGSPDLANLLCHHLADLLRNQGLSAEVDNLAA